MSPALAGRFYTTSATWEALIIYQVTQIPKFALYPLLLARTLSSVNNSFKEEATELTRNLTSLQWNQSPTARASSLSDAVTDGPSSIQTSKGQGTLPSESLKPHRELPKRRMNTLHRQTPLQRPSKESTFRCVARTGFRAKTEPRCRECREEGVALGGGIQVELSLLQRKWWMLLKKERKKAVWSGGIMSLCR